MEIFHRILKAAVDGGASDIHMKVGGPVILRIKRQLISIEAPIPTTEWMDNVINHIVPHHLKHQFDTDRDNKVTEPGPIFLQGDHGTVSFRNIRIKEIK